MYIVHLLMTTAIDAAVMNILRTRPVPAGVPDIPVSILISTVALVFVLHHRLGREPTIFQAPPTWLNTFHLCALLVTGSFTFCAWAPPTLLVAWVIITFDLVLWWVVGIRRFFKPKLAD